MLVLYRAMPKGRRARLLARIRRIGRARRLLVIDEANGSAIRVHNSRELLRAGLAKRPLLFLSPIFETRSHPDWAPLERNRLAALLRLSSAPIIALGGMNARRLRMSGWAFAVGPVSTLGRRPKSPKGHAMSDHVRVFSDQNLKAVPT